MFFTAFVSPNGTNKRSKQRIISLPQNNNVPVLNSITSSTISLVKNFNNDTHENNKKVSVAMQLQSMHFDYRMFDEKDISLRNFCISCLISVIRMF